MTIKPVASPIAAHAEQSPIGLMIVIAMGALEFVAIFAMLASVHQ